MNTFMNSKMMDTVYEALNELALKLARPAEDDGLTVVAKKRETPMRWKFVNSSFDVRPEFVRSLAGRFVSPDQMARHGFLPLGFKQLSSLSGMRQAMNIGVLQPEEAGRVVEILQRILPKAVLMTIEEIRVYPIKPSVLFDAISILEKTVSSYDHPILVSYSKVDRRVKPMLTSGRLSESEVLTWLRHSLKMAGQMNAHPSLAE